MSIILHCKNCSKKIEASDSAGGKWGKCPACHNKVYVPSKPSGDELTLAPIDPAEEQRKKELLAETSRVTQELLHERAEPQEQAASEVSPEISETELLSRAGKQLSDKELSENIVECLREIADGHLDQAQQFIGILSGCPSRTVEILDRMAVSEMPEAKLQDIPVQVLSGLIRNLRSEVE